MKYASEVKLGEIKTEIFQEILDAQKAVAEEYKAGIIHQSQCFSQIPPWEKKK